MIPPGFVQELLSRVDLVELIGRQVQLKKTGANYVGLCPFHGEKSPSFTVSPSKQFYHCFGCGANGDAIRFLTEQHGLGFVEAVKELAQQVGLTVPEDEADPRRKELAAQQREREATLADVLARAAAHYRKQLKASPRAIDYLKGRGLSGEIAARFALGYAPDGWRGLASVYPRYDDPLLVEAGLVIVQGEDGPEQKRYDRFRDRIMFPIRNVKGEVIAFGARVLDKGEPKYLNSPETPLFVKGRELYGLFEARSALRDSGYVLVTEGYMDVVALAQLGLPHAVATLGTACTAEHVAKLLRFTDQVVFAFDGDAAGRRAAARALEAALPHATDTRAFRFLFLPPEHDPDSFVREHGREAFEQAVAQAVPLSQQLLELAAQDCDLASVEGRARMLAQAKPLWNALPEGALRLQLLAELARRGALPLEELTALWQAHPAGRGAPRAPAPAPAEPGVDRPAPGFNRPRGAARRSGGRVAPRQREDRVLQMLLAHAEWWDQLSPQAHDLLHGLPAPHGALVAWLERELHEHGPRPWAALRVALEQEPLAEEARAALPGDEPGEETLADLERAVEALHLKEVQAELEALAMDLPVDPAQREQHMARIRELTALSQELRKRVMASS
ncbi:DNA primase [Azohydromonas caseinilytica]|uniref:DNA primase n=1 Tax=Azohydromonas caseinilytica TaxID=2728836 RepID=A0A848F4K9_9BURK|nr:DNA primase [Azohydromonas caseinilytica]NML14332.1 DNA primase [Azohydromonas caseinilytica]